jgi:hypothetical protein
MKVQVTIFTKNGKYKPMSTVFTVADGFDIETYKQQLMQRGLREIAIKRGVTTEQLRAYGFNYAKVREYDKAKIEKEKFITDYLNRRAREKKNRND